MSEFVVGDETETTNDFKGSTPPIVLLLQLADKMKAELDAGRNRSELATRHGITRPRVTQILNLLRLHPTIVERLRALTPETPARALTERRLRPLVGLPDEEQIRRVASMFRSKTFRRS